MRRERDAERQQRDDDPAGRGRDDPLLPDPAPAPGARAGFAWRAASVSATRTTPGSNGGQTRRTRGTCRATRRIRARSSDDSNRREGADLCRALRTRLKYQKS